MSDGYDGLPDGWQRDVYRDDRYFWAWSEDHYVTVGQERSGDAWEKCRIRIPGEAWRAEDMPALARRVLEAWEIAQERNKLCEALAGHTCDNCAPSTYTDRGEETSYADQHRNL